LIPACDLRLHLIEQHFPELYRLNAQLGRSPCGVVQIQFLIAQSAENENQHLPDIGRGLG